MSNPTTAGEPLRPQPDQRIEKALQDYDDGKALDELPTTTGEWTTKGNVLISPAGCQFETTLIATRLANHINAALDAEREKRAREIPQHSVQQCVWEDCPKHGRQQLREQLAVAVEALKKASNDLACPSLSGAHRCRACGCSLSQTKRELEAALEEK